MLVLVLLLLPLLPATAAAAATAAVAAAVSETARMECARALALGSKPKVHRALKAKSGEGGGREGRAIGGGGVRLKEPKLSHLEIFERYPIPSSRPFVNRLQPVSTRTVPGFFLPAAQFLSTGHGYFYPTLVSLLPLSHSREPEAAP